MGGIDFENLVMSIEILEMSPPAGEAGSYKSKS